MMKEELERLMRDYNESYGTFQLGRMIVARAGGTQYGIYRQALRELNTRIETLKGLYLEEEELLVDMSECVEKRSDTSISQYDMEREAIKVKRCQLRTHTLKRKIERKVDEVKHLFNVAKKMKGILGEITPERRDRLETELSIYHIKRCAIFEMQAFGKLSYGSVESIFSLDSVDRMQLTEVLKSPETMKEFLLEGCDDPPAVQDSLTDDEIKGLLE
jgi:hypothetical protein